MSHIGRSCAVSDHGQLSQLSTTPLILNADEAQAEAQAVCFILCEEKWQ